jgi:hypothetical protein
MGTIRSDDEKRECFWVKVTVMKSGWSKGRGLRQGLKTNNLAERRYERPLPSPLDGAYFPSDIKIG